MMVFHVIRCLDCRGISTAADTGEPLEPLMAAARAHRASEHPHTTEYDTLSVETCRPMPGWEGLADTPAGWANTWLRPVF
ncbi:hypothetical protein [Streptomyces yaizuensis]|uniref:Uncharacterized protein n=1 Tax=Streptomyces yaizuensis TaxID=2989713 RepID=A0ABQ5P2P4_9ACTN|nr:hypothetical protein [Streptomyces sp. YSPA8]GLF96882.1 hypothetical protein SYYSPA8_21315 [Streptomyces sp. YSPA8]